MANFRYIFGSLRTEQVIDEISLYGVYMNMEMNVGGQFQGTFQLDQTGKDNETLISACEPGRTWVACERNGQAIWHGYVWSRVYSAQSKSVQLFCQSFETYPKKRIIRTDLSYSAVEQRNVFRDLWTQMQTPTGGNLNINVPASFSTVVPIDLEILATDLKFYDNVMNSIADGVNGFDWYIQITKDGNLYRKDLQIGYPTLGTLESAGMNVFEFPGNVTQYYYTEPMQDAGTNIYVVGSGEGSNMILGTYENTQLITEGSPIWDAVISRKDIDNQEIIDGIAEQQGLVRKPPMSVIKLSVKGDLVPEFGSYNLGDLCKIYIRDARFPGNGFSSSKRLLKWELYPPSSDRVEEAQLVFEGDPDL